MTELHELTYWGLLLAVFARQLCLPIPAPLFLMTAGALSAHGHLHLSLVLVASVVGCLAGDGVWFWCGRRWGHRVTKLVCRLTSDPANCSLRAKTLFQRWGFGLIVAAKFVPGLDGVTPPLAAAEGTSVKQFVLADALGALLWSLFYSLLGFIFADELQRAAHVARGFGSVLSIILGVPLIFWIVWRAWTIISMIRELKFRRITPELLHQKMQRGEKLAVIDLLGFEGHDVTELGIPGSIRISAARLKNGPMVVVPKDVEIVLYCSSHQQILSARVALGLKRRGVRAVSVLEGGLDAWRHLGFDLSNEFGIPEDVAARLGIEFLTKH